MKEEITTNCTFTGKTAEKLSLKELEQIIPLLDAGGKPKINHIIENCAMKQLEKVFGKKKIGETKDILFGLRILKVSYVPLGEIWLMDKDGKVIRKFSLN